MRGAGRGTRQPYGARGSIPADTGNRSSSKAAWWEHPRGCREQPGPCKPSRVRQGTSPRMRGAGPERQLSGTGPGVSPKCGEQRWKLPPIRSTPGTPPPVRGTDRHERGHRVLPGGIPHGCGEQARTYPDTENGAGTPPRVRGAGAGHPPPVRVGGNIPADAGSRGTRTYEISLSLEHPRGYGEQSRRAARIATSPASSGRGRPALLGCLPPESQGEGRQPSSCPWGGQAPRLEVFPKTAPLGSRLGGGSLASWPRARCGWPGCRGLDVL